MEEDMHFLVTSFLTLVAAFFVLSLQSGYAMLEAGVVQEKNTRGVVTKALTNVALTALAFFAFGYPFALGRAGNGFLSHEGFFASHIESDEWARWVLLFGFIAAGVAIAGGAMAERCQPRVHVCLTLLLSTWIFPILAHWCWSVDGWLSPTRLDDRFLDNGFFDFAGSTIVHVVAGLVGLLGALFLGPRKGRFENGVTCNLEHSNLVLSALGIFVLWLGWLGSVISRSVEVGVGVAGDPTANCVSAVAKGMVSAILSASACFISVSLLCLTLDKGLPIEVASKGILAGLVAISASAPLIEPWAAVLTGLVAACIFYTTSRLLHRFQIDDVLDGASIHFFCGVWGTLVPALFATEKNVTIIYGASGNHPHFGLFYGGGAEQLAIQVIGLVCIMGWAGVWTTLLFFLLKRANWLRVSPELEAEGFDKDRQERMKGYRYPTKEAGGGGTAGGAGAGGGSGSARGSIGLRNAPFVPSSELWQRRQTTGSLLPVRGPMVALSPSFARPVGMELPRQSRRPLSTSDLRPGAALRALATPGLSDPSERMGRRERQLRASLNLTSSLPPLLEQRQKTPDLHVLDRGMIHTMPTQRSSLPHVQLSLGHSSAPEFSAAASGESPVSLTGSPNMAHEYE